MGIKKNFSTLSIGSILIVGLILRLKGLFSPILDLYPMRQEQCAMIARNFFRHGINIFNAQVDWFGNFNSHWSLEFPLLSYLTAILYRLFGVQEFIGRIIVILFSLGSIFILFKLAGRFFDRKTALFASLIFALSPLSIYFGRVFMPEALMMFFSIGALYFYVLFLEEENNRNFIWTLFFLMLAILIKLTSLYLVLLILFLSWLKYRQRLFGKWKLWALLILAVLPALIWYTRTNFFILDNLDSFSKISYYFSSKEFYKRMLERFSIFVFTPAGIPLFCIGFFKKPDNRKQYLFYAWFLVLVLYLVRIPEFHFTHYYYQFPFVPVVSVFIGRGLAMMTNREFIKQTIFSAINQKAVIALSLILFLLCSFFSIQPFYKYNNAAFEAGLLIREKTEPGSLIIAGYCSQEAPLYYCDRRGWEINESGHLSYDWAYKGSFPLINDPVMLTKYLIDQGADYYLALNLPVFNKQSEVKKYLEKTYQVWSRNENYIIFKLKNNAKNVKF